MANMSYCRFHNTVYDMNDCVGVLEEMQYSERKKVLSKSELEKAKEMIEVAEQILEYREMVYNEIKNEDEDE